MDETQLHQELGVLESERRRREAEDPLRARDCVGGAAPANEAPEVRPLQLALVRGQRVLDLDDSRLGQFDRE
jgi:hypothetical protein